MGLVCAYAGCGSSKRTNPNIKLYRFPVGNDKDRQHKWVVNSGNARLLTLEPEKLRNCYLCQNHFEDASFVNVTKHRLTKNAVPISHTPQGSIDSPRIIKSPTKKSSQKPPTSAAIPSSPIRKMNIDSGECSITKSPVLKVKTPKKKYA